jgi:hypothetical protein
MIICSGKRSQRCRLNILTPSVNRELIQLYWDIGHLIVERQRAQGWGRSVVERLAADIQKGFPGMAGFSPQNIWKMRSFFLAWTAEVRNRW